MNKLAAILLVLQIVHDATSVYLHVPSRVEFKHPKGANNSQFGFSIAYQNGDAQRLVIGAPRDTYIGKVFTCPLQHETAATKSVKCEEVNIDLEALSNSSRVGFPDQSYHLGASVAATPDYFLTCAPLMTAAIKPFNSNPTELEYDATGACFVYNDTAYRYYDVFQRYVQNERVKNQPILKRTFLGGTGWNSLVDDVNGLLLVMKSSLDGDILHVPLEQPLTRSTSRTLLGYHYKPLTREHKYDWDIAYVQAHMNAGFGVTAGTFFSNETVYAFSLQTKATSGEILFLQYKKALNRLQTMIVGQKRPVKITNDDIGSMFGSVLSSADLNEDGYADLLVGAPTYSDEDHGVEVGAVHIYIGGNEFTKDADRQRTIKGNKESARFGSAIATSDVDEDGIPEIFVSAPFEDDDAGALYVFSGHSIKSFLSVKEASYKQSLSQIKHQRIQVKEFKHFGYSLQVAADKNSKTCNAMAVGAPASDSVLLFRCVPAIHVELSAEPILVVSTRASEFTVEVCATIRYPSKATNIDSYLILVSRVLNSGTDIDTTDAVQNIFLSSRKETNCHQVRVKLMDSEPHQYLFEAQVDLNDEMLRNINQGEDFKDSWISMTEQSVSKVNLEVSRHCTGEECNPKLSLSLNWTGKQDEQYTLGSSNNEMVKLIVRNDGNCSYEACVIVTIQGAPAFTDRCKELGQKKYQCDMPRPLRMGEEDPINIILDFTKPNSTDEMLLVEAELRENCKISANETKTLNVSYVLNTDFVYINGTTEEYVITDNTVLDDSIQELKNGHDFEIINNGSTNWINVQAVITVMNKPYLKSISTERACSKETFDKSTIFACNLTLMGYSTEKITITTDITKDALLKSFIKGKLKTSSELMLYLSPMNIKIQSSTTQFILKKELSIANNKDLILIIAIIVACVILALVTYALYKANFFKRNEKQRLKTLRESVRRHSIKKSVSERARSSCVDGEPILDTEVLEDPFDDVQLKETTVGGVQVQEQAQVH